MTDGIGGVRPDLDGFFAIACCVSEGCDWRNEFGPGDYAWWDRETRAKRSAAAHRSQGHETVVRYRDLNGARIPRNPLDDLLDLGAGASL